MIKEYGIRITLPSNDPMRASHLLGSAWETYKWFATATERDRVWQDMRQKHPYNRIGDYASQTLSRVERDSASV